MSEGFKRRIQAIKSAARRRREFEKNQAGILFDCGKLDMKPAGIGQPPHP